MGTRWGDRRLTRDERLACELFYSVEEARWLTEEFRVEYNSVRPHGSLGGLTPNEFAAACRGHAPDTLDKESTEKVMSLNHS